MTAAAIVVVSAAACAAPDAAGEGEGEQEDEHVASDFANYTGCVEHEKGEGAAAQLALAECDEVFSITHSDKADCIADHQPDKADGLADADIEEHCARTFP